MTVSCTGFLGGLVVYPSGREDLLSVYTGLAKSAKIVWAGTV